MSQDKQGDSAARQDPPIVPPALGPLGPKVAAGDPPGRGDDWDAFKREAKATYPGIDISGLDPDEVRRWIEGIRQGLKMKGNG